MPVFINLHFHEIFHETFVLFNYGDKNAPSELTSPHCSFLYPGVG